MTREAWERHPNFDGPAAVLLSIHQQFRAASARMVQLARAGADVASVARIFIPLARTLHNHHHAEEAMLFPFIQRRTQLAPAQLVADHEELTRAMEAVTQALRASVAMCDPVVHLDAVLTEHLDREEELVVPVLLELSPTEAWASIHSGP